jgi:SAM-dependent methyltransferase
MHENSMLLFRKYALTYFDKPDMRILEIGPGWPSEYEAEINKAPKWDTLDWGNSTFKLVSEYEFGLPSNTYDLVISGQVIEHVRKIWKWMPEAARVCKPGGIVITINPVSWPYHTAPYDCWRIYPDGARALYEDAGLHTILSVFESLDGSVTDTITIGQKV